MAKRGHGEGSIYQRSDGRWAASISLEGTKRKTFYGKTRKEAQEQLKTALHEQQKGLFHDLRHGAATMLLGMGVHPKIVQEILGHNQISMTLDTYSHVLPTMQREAMSKMTRCRGDARLLLSTLLSRGQNEGRAQL